MQGANVPQYGPQFYDTEAVFDTYVGRRARAETPNDTLEGPVVRELVGDVSGFDILDLGCGNGAFGKELLDAGARSYLGIDGSRRMIESSTMVLAGTRATSIHCSLEDWQAPSETFDLVTARLVLHYIEDLPRLLTKVSRALRRNGALVFSVEHPVITSSDRAWAGGGERQDWIVDDYFRMGRRVTNWMGQEVVKYHRTVESHVRALLLAGFRLEGLREAEPQRHNFQNEETYLRRQRIPLFLVMAGRKA
jgi:predicted TPR repeat methyltransferase